MNRISTRSRLLLIIWFSFLQLSAFSQLTNGGLHAYFGVDADTKSDYIKYGAITGSIKSDDWFATSGTSKGVIDTSNAAYYKTLLKNNENIAFVKPMSAPLYTKLNNTLWIDAVYCRDFIKIDSAHLDSTAFTTACKNGADPSTWVGGISSVSNKNDLLDVYTHMRRNGTNITDSLWLFTAASTTGTSGSRYYDIELLKNPFSFNAGTGAFSSAGPDGGHAQWKFDASGKVIETGDMIVAITYSPGVAPAIEVRIWVSRIAFNTVTPSLFNFGANFDASTNTAPFGYASIISKTGNTAFGAGAGNYTATATDTTYSTPWGTSSSTWNANYQPLQLVEIGLNLTRIGLDPSLYSALGNQACGSFFKSIFYKSRSSASFSSNLNDFVGPLDFMRIPVLDHTIKTDTLSCKKPIGTLKVTSNTTAALYQWKTPSGVTMSASSMAVNKPGLYTLQSTIATGCAVGRVDTVVVMSDSLKPVAAANIAADGLGMVQLFGGDPIASNYATPFGGSKGLTYSWTGPSGFTSVLQNPLISLWGAYNLTVTEIRNGCTSTATVAAMLSILADNDVQLSGKRSNNEVKLNWNPSNKDQLLSFDVERALPGKEFMKIATVNAVNTFNYSDDQPGLSANRYRIRQVAMNGQVYYSNTISVAEDVSKAKAGYFTHAGDQDKWWLVIESPTVKSATVSIYTTAGQLISVQQIKLVKGRNTLPLNCEPINNKLVKVGVVSDNNGMLLSSSFQ